MGHSPIEKPINNDFCPDVRSSIKNYQNSDFGFSLWQTISTAGALVACYAVLYLGVAHNHLLVLLIAPLASGLAVRTFVLQHDCGHGSLFKHPWINDFVGRIFSLLTFTPYDHWKRHHSIHHSGWNNIDCRGKLSNIYSDCITISEYKSMSRFKRLFYRISQNPVVTIFLMPPFIFFLVYRISFDTPKTWLRERWGVYLTNLGLLICYGGLIHFLNIRAVTLVTFTVIYPASVAGVWLFLVQHKFDGVHWEREQRWTAFEASLTGCSFLHLPNILRWFSGNIGLHHVHHAAPGIPNYRLAACHHAHPVFHSVKVLSLSAGIKEASKTTLWDDVAGKMVDIKTVI